MSSFTVVPTMFDARTLVTSQGYDPSTVLVPMGIYSPYTKAIELKREGGVELLRVVCIVGRVKRVSLALDTQGNAVIWAQTFSDEDTCKKFEIVPDVGFPLFLTRSITPFYLHCTWHDGASPGAVRLFGGIVDQEKVVDYMTTPSTFVLPDITDPELGTISTWTFVDQGTFSTPSLRSTYPVVDSVDSADDFVAAYDNIAKK